MLWNYASFFKNVLNVETSKGFPSNSDIISQSFEQLFTTMVFPFEIPK